MKLFPEKHWRLYDVYMMNRLHASCVKTHHLLMVDNWRKQCCQQCCYAMTMLRQHTPLTNQVTAMFTIEKVVGSISIYFLHQQQWRTFVALLVLKIFFQTTMNNTVRLSVLFIYDSNLVADFYECRFITNEMYPLKFRCISSSCSYSHLPSTPAVSSGMILNRNSTFL